MKCDGCEKEMEGRRYAVTLSPLKEHRFTVCEGRGAPAAPCVARLLRKHEQVCPGCGGRRLDRVRGVCGDCIEALQRDLGARDREGKTARHFAWYRVATERGSFGWHGDARQQGSLVRAILKLVANRFVEFGEPPGVHGFNMSWLDGDKHALAADPSVELDGEQADQLRGIAKLLASLTRSAFLAGQNDGMSFLHNLASGRVSVEEYNEAEIRRAKNGAGT